MILGFVVKNSALPAKANGTMKKAKSEERPFHGEQLAKLC
jgi:hypothetical protein